MLATDRVADALAFAGANAAENGVTVETAVCAWSDPGPVLDRAPWDLVLAADVLYGQRGIDELTPLLPRLVEGGEVWVADPERPLAPAFLAAARERWAEVETLPTRQHDVRIHRLAGPDGRTAGRVRPCRPRCSTCSTGSRTTSAGRS